MPYKFESASKLAVFFNSNKNFGTNLAKLIVSIGVVGIRYTSYIITITLIEPSILELYFQKLPIKPVTVPRNSNALTGKMIYGYNPTTKEYRQ